MTQLSQISRNSLSLAFTHIRTERAHLCRPILCELEHLTRSPWASTAAVKHAE